MELTPAEKQKIYEEEKAKVEAQEQIKKEQQQKKAKNVGIGCLSVIVIMIVLAIIGSNSNNTSTVPSSVKTSIKPDLEIISTSNESDTYCWYVTGTVKNNSSSKTYSYVQVEVNLYDKSDAQVGSTLANTNNLEPGGLWKFKAIVTEDSARKYKVKGVTGW